MERFEIPDPPKWPCTIQLSGIGETVLDGIWCYRSTPLLPPVSNSARWTLQGTAILDGLQGSRLMNYPSVAQVSSQATWTKSAGAKANQPLPQGKWGWWRGQLMRTRWSYGGVERAALADRRRAHKLSLCRNSDQCLIVITSTSHTRHTGRKLRCHRADKWDDTLADNIQGNRRLLQRRQSQC